MMRKEAHASFIYLCFCTVAAFGGTEWETFLEGTSQSNSMSPQSWVGKGLKGWEDHPHSPKCVIVVLFHHPLLTCCLLQNDDGGESHTSNTLTGVQTKQSMNQPPLTLPLTLCPLSPSLRCPAIVLK